MFVFGKGGFNVSFMVLKVVLGFVEDGIFVEDIKNLVVSF